MPAPSPGKWEKPLFFSLALLFLLAPAAYSATSGAANTDLVSKGRGFADELFGPMLKLLEPLGFGADNPYSMIQFLAAFTLIFFLVKEMTPGTSDFAAFTATLIGAGAINLVFRLDWYTFLIHFSPALLMFFFLQDILARFSFMFRSTSRWIALFGMILVFYTDYALFTDNGVFGFFFNKLFGQGYSIFLEPWSIIIFALLATLVRVAGLVEKVFKSESANQYRRQMQAAVNIIPQEVVKGGMRDLAKQK